MLLPYRSHVSFEKFDVLDDKDYSINDTSIKPHGFWYGIRCDWSKHVKEEMGIKARSYLYEVRLKPRSLATFNDYPDVNKVLQLKTEEDARTFLRKYVNIVDPNKFTFSWSKLKKDYGGVEIPNIRVLRNIHDPTLGTWDVSSGVIWNLSIINSCRYVRRKK